MDVRTITYNYPGAGNHAELQVNGGRIHLSHLMRIAHGGGASWRRHSFTTVAQVPDNGLVRVRVHCSTTTFTHCWHSMDSVSGYTQLSMQRLSSAVTVAEFGPPTSNAGTRDNKYHFMSLGHEVFNTNPEVISKVSDKVIKILKAGWYRIDFRVISHHNAGAGSHAETWLNGARLHLSHSMDLPGGTQWRRHATSVVANVPADSNLQVRMYCASTVASHCWHDYGSGYTRLTVQLME